MSKDVKDNKDKQELSQELDDIIIEPEQQEGVSSFAKSQSSEVQKLKKQLKAAKQKAKENLDGWQRLKADIANNKKLENQRLKREQERGVEKVLESLLPALDSFDSAMHGSAWESIDEAWRTGMEFVHSQLVSALESHGITSYGSVGEDFNADEHEAAEHMQVDSKEQDNKIQKVLRKGYKSKNGVIRPARVMVGDFKS